VDSGGLKEAQFQLYSAGGAMWAHWRHLANTIEPSVCGGDAVLCQITLTTCFWCCTLLAVNGIQNSSLLFSYGQPSQQLLGSCFLLVTLTYDLNLQM